ncbi:LexA family transcriptional repressor, partial [Klebsiella pneumoniae]
KKTNEKWFEANLAGDIKPTSKSLVINAVKRFLNPPTPHSPLTPINGNARFIGVVADAKITNPP